MKKALVIDMDGQCNLFFLLGLDNDQLQQEEQQAYAVLTGKQSIGSCIMQVGGLDLLPASPALYISINQIGKEYKLREASKAVTVDYAQFVDEFMKGELK